MKPKNSAQSLSFLITRFSFRNIYSMLVSFWFPFEYWIEILRWNYNSIIHKKCYVYAYMKSKKSLNNISQNGCSRRQKIKDPFSLFYSFNNFAFFSIQPPSFNILFSLHCFGKELWRACSRVRNVNSLLQRKNVEFCCWSFCYLC